MSGKMSFFDGVLPEVVLEEDVSWERLKELLGRPTKTPCAVPCTEENCQHKFRTTGWSPVVFSDKRRKKRTAHTVSYLVFDIDDVSIDRLEQLTAEIEKDGFRYLISSTHSHNPPDNCRIRLVFDLECSATVQQFQLLREAVAQAYAIPVDGKTGDVCRFYYLPSLGTIPPEKESILAESIENFSEPFVFRCREGKPLPLPDVEDDKSTSSPRAASVPVATKKSVNKQVAQINDLVTKAAAELKRLPEKFRTQSEKIAAENLALLEKVKNGEPLGEVGVPGNRDNNQVSVLRELARLSVIHAVPLNEKAVIAWGATTATLMGADGEDLFINRWEEKCKRIFPQYVEEFSATYERALAEDAPEEDAPEGEEAPLPSRGNTALPKTEAAPDPVFPPRGPPKERKALDNVVPIRGEAVPGHTLLASMANPQAYTTEQVDAWAEEYGCMAWELRERKIIASAEALWAFKDGEYVGPFPIGREHVAVSWLQSVLSKWDDIEWQVMNPRTLRLQRVSLESLLSPMSAHAKIAQRVTYDYRVKSAMWHEDTRELVLNGAPLRKLTPEYNEQIETWLSTLVAPENLGQLLDYLTALTWQHLPCAALVLVGSKSVGKQLLATGISQLWRVDTAIPLKEAAARFNVRMISCPFMWADEEFPEEVSSRQFRAMLGNAKHDVEQKRGAVSALKGFLRGLITVNSEGALSLQDAAKSAADVEAVAQRFLRMDVQEKAEKYLISLGNYDTTTAWVNPQNPLLAKHILWIQEQRSADLLSRRGKHRFIVEGTAGGLLKHLTASGLGAVVAEELLERINKIKDHDAAVKEGKASGERPFLRDLVIRNKSVYVSLPAIKSWLKARRRDGDRTHINPGEIATILAALSEGQERLYRNALGRPRYFKLNTLAIFANADVLSTGSDKLELIQWLLNREDTLDPY